MLTAPDPDALGPRSLLVMLAVFAGLTLVVVLGSAIAGALGPAPRTRVAPEPAVVRAPEADVLAFLGPLATGQRLDGWVIERVEGRREGGLPLVLRGPEGQRLQVELRPLDAGSPPAPATSATLAIYVRGREMPPGGLAGVLALARALRQLEAGGARLGRLEPLRYTR